MKKNKQRKTRKKESEWQTGRELRDETERPCVSLTDPVTANSFTFWVNWVKGIKTSNGQLTAMILAFRTLENLSDENSLDSRYGISVRNRH